METFADKVIHFNQNIEFHGTLPKNIKMMNPFQENKKVQEISRKFYKKFYDDNKSRGFIIGINPGRLGAGVTGIPFTDTKRLEEVCKIPIKGPSTHEPSSVFVYDLIERYGGPRKFYGDFYIHSICPLGFIEKNKKGNWINCNYYDHEDLYISLKGFIIENMRKQISFGIDQKVVYVMGKKNAKYVRKINDEEGFFEKIIELNHPRYIVQYKSKQKEQYFDNYLMKLGRRQ